MKKILWVLVFSCFLSFFGVILLIWIFRLYPVEKSSDVAAWMQAIGSVFAIIAAIGVGWYSSWSGRRAQVEQEGRARKRLEKSYHHGVEVFFWAIGFELDFINSCKDSRGLSASVVKMMIDGLEMLLRDLNKIPLHDIDSIEKIQMIKNIEYDVMLLLSGFRDFLKGNCSNSDGMWDIFNTFVDSFETKKKDFNRLFNFSLD